MSNPVFSRWQTTILLTLLLSGCALEVKPISNVGPLNPATFECPQAGTKTIRLARTARIEEVWQGSDLQNPHICIVQSQGQVNRLLYQIRTTPFDSGEGVFDAAVTDAFAAKPPHYIRFATSVSGKLPYAYEGYFQQLGQTTINLEDKQHTVIVFILREKGIGLNYYNGTVYFYYDPSLNLVVKAQSDTIRGSEYEIERVSAN